MEEIDIKEYFNYLKHYVFAFIIAIVLMVGGILAYDTMIKKPIYQANTTVVIAKANESEGLAATISDLSASQKLANTYSEIAKSELVLNRTIEELDLHMSSKELSSSITIKPLENTSIISIAVKDQNATRAATIANGIAKVFAEEVAKIYKLNNVSQLSVATTPSAPSNNTMTRDIVLATIIAVLGVAGFAFLRFYLDDSVKHTDDIEKIIGLPVTGSISRNDS